MVERREVDVDSRPVPYRVAGGGEPLVLVHGLAGSWRWWTPLIEPLAAPHRVYVVDLGRVRHLYGPDPSAWPPPLLDAIGLPPGDGPWDSLRRPIPPRLG